MTIELGTRQSDVPTFFGRDNGGGIYENDLDRLTMPLTRTEHDGLNTKGIGMGLALVRAIVERHGAKERPFRSA